MLSHIKKLLLATGIVGILAAVSLSLPYKPLPVENKEILHPTNPHDLPKISALLLMERTSGSSTLVRSGPDGSDFLTNEHVCVGSKHGGMVILDGKTYEMTAIKPSKYVDLCLVHVKENLHLSTEMAKVPPRVGDEVLTGGYPLTLPIVIQKGYISRVINVGTRKDPQPLMVVSVLVQPGHSGTGIFDAQGKLVGVIDAMRIEKKTDTIGFGLAVPFNSMKIFMEKESKILQWIPVPHVPRS